MQRSQHKDGCRDWNGQPQAKGLQGILAATRAGQVKEQILLPVPQLLEGALPC